MVLRVGASYNFASGASHLDCHALAYRFDEAVGFRPERGESWVVSLTGESIEVLYGKAGWFTGLWRSLSGKVWVSDVCGRVYMNPDRRPRAAPWQRFELGGILEGIWGLDDDHVYAWGRRGGRPTMFRWDGSRWSDMASPGLIVALHGTRPDLLVAVGEDGLIARWDGARWIAFPTVSERTLTGVFVASDDEMMACGKANDLLQGSVHGWTRLLESPDLTGCVAKWRDRWWVGAGGDLGLSYLEGDRLISHKKKVMPTMLDARVSLLCSCPHVVASSEDGESFSGAPIAGFANIRQSEAPLWKD